MDPDGRVAWIDLAKLMYENLSRFSGDVTEGRSLARFDRLMGRIADAVAPSGGEWDAAASARVASLLRTTVSIGEGGKPGLPRPVDLVVKSAKVAHSLVFGPDIRSDDAGFICRNLPGIDEEVDDERVVVDHRPAAFGLLDFAFVHSQVGSRGRRSIAMSHGIVRLERVGIEEAPVACRLMSCDGGWIDVRHRAGTFLRPVLHPGCFAPIREDAFAAAARDGRAWVDSPYLSPPDPWESLVDMMDVSEPPDRSDRDRERREATALSHALARAGHLCVIDRHVYRTTPPPTFHIVAERPFRRADDSGVWRDDEGDWYATEARSLTHPRGDLRLGWRMGSLDAFSSQDTFRAWWREVDWTVGGFPVDAWTLAAGDHRLFEETFAELCAVTGSTPPTTPWEIVDPSCLPCTGRGADDVLRDLVHAAVAGGLMPCDAAASILGDASISAQDALVRLDASERDVLAALEAVAQVARNGDLDPELAAFQP